MVETTLTCLIAGSVLAFFVVNYWRAHISRETAAKTRIEQGRSSPRVPGRNIPRSTPTAASVAGPVWRRAQKEMCWQ